MLMGRPGSWLHAWRFSLVQLCLQVRSSALLRLWRGSLGPFDDLSWSVTVVSLITRTAGYTLSSKAFVEFTSLASKVHGSDELSLSWQFRKFQTCRFQLRSVCTWNRSIIFATVHASGQYLELVSYVFLQVAQINGVTAAVIVLLLFFCLFKRVPLCGRGSCGLVLSSFRCKCGSGLSPEMTRTHRSMNSFTFIGTPHTTRRDWGSRRHRLIRVQNARLSSAEILSSGKVSSGSRDTTRSILSSVGPARFNACQPATSGRAVTMSTPSRCNLPSCSLYRTSHMAIGSPFVLAKESSRKKAHSCGQEAFSPRERERIATRS